VNSQRSWDNWWRAGGVFGLIFVILFIIGGIGLAGDTPTRDDSIEEIRAYFQDDGDIYLIGDYISGLAFVFFFIPYLVILRWVLGSREGWPALGSWLTVLGGVLMVALGGAGAMTFGTLALSADNSEIDDSSVRLLVEMNSYAFSLFAYGMALFTASASIVVLRTGVLWRWLAAIGLLAAVLLIIGASWPIDGDEEGALAIPGFIGAPLTLLWIIISSVNLLLMKEEPVSRERATA
jgi:hypothetical protein